ncbi:MAG: rRNA maturation RNase YbeY [Saprospiraceae bacterium]
MAIRYFSEDRSIPKFLKRRAVTAWLDKLAKAHQKSIAEINFIFCSDESLLQVNQEYLSHDYYTDIISFDNSNSDGLRGDIFISLDRVKDNAQTILVSATNKNYIGSFAMESCTLLDIKIKEEESAKYSRGR